MLLRLIMYLLFTAYLLGIEWAAAIIGQRSKHSTWQEAYKWLVMVCWVTAVMETTSGILTILRIKHEIFYNIWGCLETGSIIIIQLRLMMHRWAKRLLIAMLIVLTAGTVINYIWGPPMNDMNIPFQLFTLFIQLITTCAALIDILGSTSDKPLSAQPAFWLDTGMLFYCSVFILDYITGIYFKSPGPIGWFFMACSTVANTFMYGGFIACFITLRREDRRKNPVTSAA